MKTSYVVGLTLVAGVAMGAGAVQVLHAQAKPPVYMIAINEVSNPEGYAKEYAPLAMKSIKDQGGVYIAAGQGVQVTGICQLAEPWFCGGRVWKHCRSGAPRRNIKPLSRLARHTRNTTSSLSMA